MMNGETQLMREISIVDFVLVDLMLYLDTHPHDRSAMEHFNHYNRIKNRMERDFAMKFFPLTKDMAECDNEWTWSKAPMPWEGGCR
jgi:spore coat protein JB